MDIRCSHLTRTASRQRPSSQLTSNPDAPITPVDSVELGSRPAKPAWIARYGQGSAAGIIGLFPFVGAKHSFALGDKLKNEKKHVAATLANVGAVANCVAGGCALASILLGQSELAVLATQATLVSMVAPSIAAALQPGLANQVLSKG